MIVREAPERLFLLQHAGALGTHTPPPCSKQVTIAVRARMGNSSVTYSIYCEYLTEVGRGEIAC